MTTSLQLARFTLHYKTRLFGNFLGIVRADLDVLLQRSIFCQKLSADSLLLMVHALLEAALGQQEVCQL
jgi:hypothetical protein